MGVRWDTLVYWLIQCIICRHNGRALRHNGILPYTVYHMSTQWMCVETHWYTDINSASYVDSMDVRWDTMVYWLIQCIICRHNGRALRHTGILTNTVYHMSTQWTCVETHWYTDKYSVSYVDEMGVRWDRPVYWHIQCIICRRNGCALRHTGILTYTVYHMSTQWKCVETHWYTAINSVSYVDAMDVRWDTLVYWHKQCIICRHNGCALRHTGILTYTVYHMSTQWAYVETHWYTDIYIVSYVDTMEVRCDTLVYWHIQCVICRRNGRALRHTGILTYTVYHISTQWTCVETHWYTQGLNLILGALMGSWTQW